jgi:hypothetical protein
MELLNFLGKSLRNTGAIGLGVLGALSAFGLLLSLAWLPAFSEATVYKLDSLLAVAGIAFFSGGFLSGLAASEKPTGCGLAFGLLLGLCSFGYVLGQDWLVLPFTAATCSLGAAGGWLSSRCKRMHK